MSYKIRPIRKLKGGIISKLAVVRVPSSKYNEFVSKPIHEDDLDEILKNAKWFIGTFDDGELEGAVDIIAKHFETHKVGGFIILHDFHFTACIINLEEYTCEYYDSFGKNPKEPINVFLHEVVKKLKPKYMLRFKINEKVNQNANTNNCGIFSVMFLINRLYKHRTFAESTDYDIMSSERRARKAGKILKSFGYI